MRSAKAPTISAGVMTAKVIWKVVNTVSGMVPVMASTVTPARNALPSPPTKAFMGPVGEGEAVAVDRPQQGHHAGDGEALHQHRQHVLAAHHAGVEQRQAGNGHEQHQRGGRDHPGGVAGVELVGAAAAAAAALRACRRRARTGLRTVIRTEADAALEYTPSRVAGSGCEERSRARRRRSRRCGCGWPGGGR